MGSEIKKEKKKRSRWWLVLTIPFVYVPLIIVAIVALPFTIPFLLWFQASDYDGGYDPNIG